MREGRVRPVGEPVLLDPQHGELHRAGRGPVGPAHEDPYGRGPLRADPLRQPSRAGGSCACSAPARGGTAGGPSRSGAAGAQEGPLPSENADGADATDATAGAPPTAVGVTAAEATAASAAEVTAAGVTRVSAAAGAAGATGPFPGAAAWTGAASSTASSASTAGTAARSHRRPLRRVLLGIRGASHGKRSGDSSRNGTGPPH